jgi:imidazole glycerol-phosphate synthase subunit HisH
MKKNIVIIDYGVGNTHSVREAINLLDCNVSITDDPEKLEKADALILPGVGAFEAAMKNLLQRELIKPLQELVIQQSKPILGICLGMQLLADYSEENGYHEGLGWISGKVIKIESKRDIRVPHVGWNDVEVMKKQPLFERIIGEANFYFDHSYHFIPSDGSTVAATVNYAVPLVAAVKKDNIYGVQFHPEKSQVTGLRLLKGFLNSVYTHA